jgi:transposase InsO family protein
VDHDVAFLCRLLKASRPGYYKWQRKQDESWKYEELLTAIMDVLAEDEENAAYGAQRMSDALTLKGIDYSKYIAGKVMKSQGLGPVANKRTPNSLTREDKLAQKAENLIGHDWYSPMPNCITITGLTEVACLDGKLYVSTVFDCFDAYPLGLAMADHMRAELACDSLLQAATRFDLRGAIIHDDRGGQYTSGAFKELVKALQMHHSMNSAGGRCQDNARCESLWARFKTEKIYRMDTTQYTIEEMRGVIYRYFMSYWANRRINTAIGGVPPATKRALYYEHFAEALKAKPI